jgi:hypothetical protein
MVSKKQWLYHDDKGTEIACIILSVLSSTSMYYHCNNISTVKKILYFSGAVYIADLITALVHCYHIDRAIFRNRDIVLDKVKQKLVCNVSGGYASWHHIFPSNWKDIDDKVLLRDMVLTLAPFLILNLFNPSSEGAYFNYCVLLSLVICPIGHKYAHERNHKRPVPKSIKMLQDLGLLLSGPKHKKHHEELNCDYGLVNGSIDALANFLIKAIDKWLKLESSEDSIRMCKRYVAQYGKDIPIQFVGDIEGEIVVNLSGNILTMKRRGLRSLERMRRGLNKSLESGERIK